jgi:hypothetical protein
MGLSATSERVQIECKSTWNTAAALKKIRFLKRASKAGKLTKVGKATLAARRAKAAYYQRSFGAGLGFDADHLIELVLGGDFFGHGVNLHALESPINRSIGSVIGRAVRKVGAGKKIILEFVGGC